MCKAIKKNDGKMNQKMTEMSIPFSFKIAVTIKQHGFYNLPTSKRQENVDVWVVWDRCIDNT